jgi:carbonic anhydrase/acetyltransferase-like protein (isoleucine patch superfamily)
MLQALSGKQPVIDPSAFIHPTAVLIGDVQIGANSSVWPNAAIRADFGPIIIGRHSHIEDCCVVHSGQPLEIGDNVIVGHGAVVHCGRVGSNVLVGNNSTLLDDAEVGDFCIVGAGAVLTPRMKVPPHSFVTGIPAQISPLSEKQMAMLKDWLDPAGAYTQKLKEYVEQGLGLL